MNKVSSLFLAAALSVAATAHAADRLQIQAVLTKDGQVLSTQTQEVGSGQTAHFSKTQPKEYDGKATVSSKGTKVEKEVHHLGFTADVTPHVLSTGKVQLAVNGLYTEPLSENKVKTDGVELNLPHYAKYSLASTVIVDQNGKATLERHGDKGPELQLDLTVKRL
ncbi:hypothetical protein ACQCLI_31905 (plasmid) [Pseudomonas nitroreducens]|uniref:hypothetical protein n=1 Tax=Pseudomonas nitroreducens TaxID=46680 RepID=UPI0002D64B06|nr:hypothetical protein [Pseudomonas nitroreducens]